MIPVHLKISGFLSYRDPVEIDFTAFDLACISGPNGAGKSSMLDAITWALFGQARRRDDALVNQQSQGAEVVLTFQYEDNLYRVIRQLPRGKTASLEFQIWQPQAVEDSASPSNGVWKPLTERSLRETQALLEQTLRLDYETFVNAAFFLQGKADQFAQQTPGKRKEILSNILGLEIWEEYRERVAARRKQQESEQNALDRHIQEIEGELAEEAERRAQLAELQSRLEQIRQNRRHQEMMLEELRQTATVLEKQRDLVDQLGQALQHAGDNLANRQKRLQDRQEESEKYASVLARADEIEHAYQAWQKARQEVERWEKIAGQFHLQEEGRRPLLETIAAEKARLEGEKASLEQQEANRHRRAAEMSEVPRRISAAQQSLREIESLLQQKANREAQLQQARQQEAELHAENDRLKAEVDEAKARMDRLMEAEGAHCPLCGQPLSPTERADLVQRLEMECEEKEKAWRANRIVLEELDRQRRELESWLNQLSDLESERLQHTGALAQLTARWEAWQKESAEWESKEARRLEKIKQLLETEAFAQEARQALAEIDRALTMLGYDAQAHEAARQAELSSRSAEEEYRNLEKARAALQPLEDEIQSLQKEITSLQEAVEKQEAEYQEAARLLASAESQAPDLKAAERQLQNLQDQENLLNQEVGGARQKVEVLGELRARKKRLEAERKEIIRLIGYYKKLERAFSKDGVPALLIEQALPEIETRANELLDRLSDGRMSVRFVTQAAYKDKNREDLRETLDIQISDASGVRAYELYSGGEAFRVNFAIRLALSEVLARRKGARLQTLVIDEGFGSQDTEGRQRLIEAINAVRPDFPKILVITHLDELRDAFPARIEVEKTERGSVARLV